MYEVSFARMSEWGCGDKHGTKRKGGRGHDLTDLSTVLGCTLGGLICQPQKVGVQIQSGPVRSSAVLCCTTVLYLFGEFLTGDCPR